MCNPPPNLPTLIRQALPFVILSKPKQGIGLTGKGNGRITNSQKLSQSPGRQYFSGSMRDR